MAYIHRYILDEAGTETWNLTPPTWNTENISKPTTYNRYLAQTKRGLYLTIGERRWSMVKILKSPPDTTPVWHKQRELSIG